MKPYLLTTALTLTLVASGAGAREHPPKLTDGKLTSAAKAWRMTKPEPIRIRFRSDEKTTARVETRSPEATMTRTSGYALAEDGTRLYYETVGDGPAILLIHGLGGNHAVWFHQVAHFAARHTVVTMSQRGFAPSEGDLHRYDVALLARDAVAVLDAAGVERAVVVGQSMGGWTALRLALDRPARVRALVLADTLAGIRDAAIDENQRRMVATANESREGPPKLGHHPALSPAFSEREPALAVLYQSLASFGSPSPASIAGQLATVRADDDAMKRSRVPTLFVVGSDDRLFPPSVVTRAAERLASSRVQVIEGAGHSPYFETPEAWNAAVQSFIDALP